jgi:endonuclease YncB( thermonuclease family)
VGRSAGRRSPARAARAVLLSLLALVAFAALSRAARSESYAARAVHLRDGDSLIVRMGDAQREVRIAEVDTPERGQPWSQRAKRALAELVEGRTLRVVVVDHDRYGRDVAQLFVGETCVGCELVRGGHAWAYREYLRDPELLRLEAEARAARRGLWSLPAQQQVPPWEWRHGARVASGALPEVRGPLAPDDSAGGFTCGSKLYCKEMSSCAEARFYLQHCGLARLDGDGDGLACEDLCP